MVVELLANKYAQALALVIGFFILSKLALFISEKVFLKLAKKTKNDIDDKIITNSRGPVSLLLLILGFKLGLLALALKGSYAFIAVNIIDTLFVIVGFYVALSVLVTLVDGLGTAFAKKTKSTLDDHLVSIFSKTLKVTYFIIVVLAVLKIWGVQIGPLLAGLGIGGIAIAFALQSTLGNIFGGISLILDRTVKVGDTVFVDKETKGTIMDIGLRSTRIKTFDNELIIIPNGQLANQKIQNIVEPDPSSRVVIPFSVAYGSKIDRVKKIVLKEINTIEGLDKTKEPSVRFREMADSSLVFAAYFYMKSYTERFRSIDEANTLIYNALNKAKIAIPYPQMDIHIKEHRKRK